MKQSILSALFCSFLLCFYLPESVEAQERPLIIETKVNTNKSVDFNYTKNDPATYTVIFTFNSLRNTNASDRQVAEISGLSGRALSLSPLDPSNAVGFSYKYSVIRGRVLRKVNQDFIYLLPYKEGTNVKVMEAGFVAARYFGSETPPDWKAYNFYTSREDTVVACRKGIVVEVKDDFDTSNPGSAVYKSSMNEVTIEHIDGTFVRYRGLKKGIFVKVGQTVMPGTALGMNTLFNEKSKQYNVALHAYYLTSDKIESMRDQTLKNSKSLYGSITPHFCTRENADAVLVDKTSYTATIDDEILKKELSKREIKNLLKK